MPSLAELAGSSAFQNASTPGTNVTEGLQAGVKLAQSQQSVDLQKNQLQDQQIDLQNKQSTAMSNMLQAASFSNDQKQRGILLDRVQSQANQIQVPFDREAFQASLDDDTSRIAIQQGLKDVQAGKISSSQFLSTISSAPALFNYVNSKLAESAKYLQQSAIEDKKDARALTVAQIKAAAETAKPDARANASLTRLDYTKHKDVINGLQNDKSIGALKDSYQNINNALTNFQASGRNPEEFAQLQQVLKTNSGVKGAGGVAERQASTLHDYGISAQEFVQKLSGSPQDIIKSSPKFVELVQKVAQAEIDNKRTQATSQIQKLASRNSSFYKQPGHEDVAAERDQTVADTYAQFGVAPQAAGTPASVVTGSNSAATGATGSFGPPPTDKSGKIKAIDALVGTNDPRTGAVITQAQADAEKKKRGLL